MMVNALCPLLISPIHLFTSTPFFFNLLGFHSRTIHLPMQWLVDQPSFVWFSKKNIISLHTYKFSLNII